MELFKTVLTRIFYGYTLYSHLVRVIGITGITVVLYVIQKCFEYCGLKRSLMYGKRSENESENYCRVIFTINGNLNWGEFGERVLGGR